MSKHNMYQTKETDSHDVAGDTLDRFIFDKKDLRLCYVSLEKALADNLENQSYPKPVESILSEFMAACCLLTSSLKFDGRLILQLRSETSVPLLMAECNHQGHVRAYAQLKENAQRLESFCFSDLRNGVLALTLQPEKGEQYQGIVPLDGNQLADCLKHYFAQSEQLESSFIFHQSNGRCIGFMLQQLPAQIETDTEKRAEHWTEARSLVDTLDADELLSLSSKTIVYRLFHQDLVRFLDTKPLLFRCSCSLSRMEQALISLGRDELESILLEQGAIDIQCEFCKKSYAFDGENVSEWFQGADKTLH